MKRQQDALVNVQKDGLEAKKQLDQATSEKEKESEGLLQTIASNSKLLEDPPNRHHDWIQKLRKLADATNEKALEAARNDPDPEPLPKDWAARVTRKD